MSISKKPTLPAAANQRKMRTTQEKLLTQILEHERTFRGINWLEELFDENGREKPGFVLQVVNAQLSAISERLGVPVQANPTLGSSPELMLMPVLAFTPKRYAALRELKGNAIQENLLQILADLQDVERKTQTHTGTVESLVKMAVSGIVGAGFTFAATVVKEMWDGMIFTEAVMTAGLTLGAATIAIIAAVVVVLVAFILVMMKEAREIHLVLNNTDFELRVVDVHTHDGKENFRPRNDDGFNYVPPRQIKNGNGLLFGGFFGESKRDGALIGASGALKIDLYQNGQKIHNSTYLGYCVPLLNNWFSGGPNGGLVRCNAGDISAHDFFDKEQKFIEGGNLDSSESTGPVKVLKRVASKKGSESYAITSYEQPF